MAIFFFFSLIGSVVSQNQTLNIIVMHEMNIYLFTMCATLKISTYSTHRHFALWEWNWLSVLHIQCPSSKRKPAKSFFPFVWWDLMTQGPIVVKQCRTTWRSQSQNSLLGVGGATHQTNWRTSCPHAMLGNIFSQCLLNTISCSPSCP